MPSIANKVAENSKAISTNKATTLKDYVNKYIPEIEKALPSCGVTAERMARLFTTALSSNPKLASCSPQSFLGSMMQTASLGLEPNSALGQAYLIPYGDQCTFVLGYKGLLELVYRSGQISSVQAEIVYKNDEFIYELGLDSKIIHKPKMDGDRGEPVAYYAIWHGKDGGYGFSVMSKADVDAHAKKFSKAGSTQSPWQTNFDSMALKTVLKKALKYAPISSSLIRDIGTDETVKTNFRMEDVVSGDVDVRDINPDEISGEGSVE